MLRKVLTCIILVLMYPYVTCNIVQLHNSLVVSYSLFQVFTDIHDIQIGYPIINEYGSICQTPPFTYKSLPIGVVPEIVGTLRNLNGSAVGLWYNANNCYVVPYSNNNTCTKYSFSNRLSECDNDIRLQLNAGKAGFSVIKDLQDTRLLIEKLTDSLYNIQSLDKRSVILTGAPKSALSRQIQSLLNTFKIHSETYIDKIDAYVRQDLQYIEEVGQEASLDTQTLTQSVQMGSALLRSLSRGELNQSHVDELSELHLSDFSFDSIFNSSESVEANSWFPILQLKRVAFHSIVVSMSNMIHQANMYQVMNDSCLNFECKNQNARKLFDFDILGFLQNITKFNSERIGPCGNSIIEKAMGSVYQMLDSQSKYTEPDYSLPFQWHKCLSQQTLSQHEAFSLDLSGMEVIPFSRTTDINSEQGHHGLLLLPRSSIVYVHHEKFNRAIDLSRLSSNSLIETNFGYKEAPYSPDPQPEQVPPPSVSPLFLCPPGRYGKDCSVCPIGSWSNDGFLHLCSNAPDTDAEYFVHNWPTPNCPFRCLNNKYRVNNTCQVPPDGYYPLSNQYQIDRCRTEFPSNFISYSSHGLTGRPFSCSVEAHHVLEMEYNITSILVESFSIEIWIKVNVTGLLRACDSHLCDQMRFGILDTELWSLYLSLHDSMVRLNVADNIGAAAQSKLLRLDNDWHQHVIQYDARLKLIYFSVDSVPIGGGWYNSPKSSNNIDNLIIGGARSDYPLKSRILPAQIARMHIRSSVFPMETFPMDISSIMKRCPDGLYWHSHKCIPLCRSEGLFNIADCPCTWGQFFNTQTNQCSWCPSSSVGSVFPHFRNSDCICASGYIWSYSENSCVVGKPSLVEPDVDYYFDPIPEAIENIEGIVIPLNATLVVHSPSQNAALLSLRKIVETTDGVVLDITILSGLRIVLKEQIPFEELPFHYCFSEGGRYRIEAQFNKPGHLLGTKYSQLVVVQARALPPFIRPSDPRLNGTTLFQIASQEPSENSVLYSFDGISFMIYDKRNPPAASPPVSIYMYTKPLASTVLPSQLLKTNFTWNTESENYKYALAYERAPESNTSNVQSRTVTFLVWCQKSIPNCILALVIPIVSLVVIGLGIILTLVIVRIVIKRRKTRGIHGTKDFSPIEKEKRPKKPENAVKDCRTLKERRNRAFGDIVCNMDPCKKLARFRCWNCQLYLCNSCQNTHPTDHEWIRIMICDICRRKSKRLAVFSTKKNCLFKYVCSHCVSNLSLPPSVRVIQACTQCKDEQTFSKESQHLCKSCIVLSNLNTPR